MDPLLSLCAFCMRIGICWLVLKYDGKRSIFTRDVGITELVSECPRAQSLVCNSYHPYPLN